MDTPGGWTIIPAQAADKDSLASLISHARWKHQHLDWAESLDLIGQSPFLVARRAGRLLGCLACPPDPPGVSWIRLFVCASGVKPRQVWQALWPAAESTLLGQPVETAAALTIDDWMTPLIEGSGFGLANEVIFYEWRGKEPPQIPRPAPMLRPLTAQDLDEIATVDRQAFSPIWRQSVAALALALDQSAYAVVAEFDGKPVAYQLSTVSVYGAHLARLAVDPRFQGHGFGHRLVADAIAHFMAQGIDRMTLNTQLDNKRSQTLYHSLGFRLTGQHFPVYQRDLPPAPA
jgi:ribosomal protein S18 acetylase RimI-like enzyme